MGFMGIVDVNGAKYTTEQYVCAKIAYKSREGERVHSTCADRYPQLFGTMSSKALHFCGKNLQLPGHSTELESFRIW